MDLFWPANLKKPGHPNRNIPWTYDMVLIVPLFGVRQTDRSLTAQTLHCDDLKTGIDPKSRVLNSISPAWHLLKWR